MKSAQAIPTSLAELADYVLYVLLPGNLSAWHSILLDNGWTASFIHEHNGRNIIRLSNHDYILEYSGNIPEKNIVLPSYILDNNIVIRSLKNMDVKSFDISIFTISLLPDIAEVYLILEKFVETNHILWAENKT